MYLINYVFVIWSEKAEKDQIGVKRLQPLNKNGSNDNKSFNYYLT